MGQKSTKTLPQLTDFNPHDWINDDFVLNNDPGINQFGKVYTLKNRITEQLIDKYEQMFISQKDYQDYLHSYQWRCQQLYIVNAAYMQTKNKNKYCSTTYQVDIYIEHPKNRLSDFSDIPFPDTLYVLKAMLIGYRKLFQHVGSFFIREEQVCINDRGIVKVWFNKDLSKNYPEQWEIQPAGQVDEEQEQDMVNQIIITIAKNSDPELQPNLTFKQFCLRNKKINKIGFDQALRLVDQYADQQNVQIPQNFKSVVQVYENQQDLYQMQGDLSNNMSQHQQNKDFIGQLTQGQMNLRNQSYLGSRVQKITNQQMKQKKSHRSSQIDNLQKYSSKIGNNQTQFGKMKQSVNSNKNKAQIYRLSGISRLDDKIQMPPAYQPSIQYQPSSQYQLMTTYQPNSNFNRQPQMSKFGNYYQASYTKMAKQTDRLVWMSLKPQQPYIPSSSTYLNLQTNQNFNQNLNQSNGLIKNINNLNTIRVQNNVYLNSSKPNHSIQQKAQKSNISGGHHTQQFANMKFERQLQQQIKRDKQQIQIRQDYNKQKPIKSIDNTFAEPQILLNRTHSQNSRQNSSNFIFNASNFSNGHQKPCIKGASIVIPPPQHSTNFNRFQRDLRGFYNLGQPIRMIKNSQQPYISTVPYFPPHYTRIMSPRTQIQINPQFSQPISPKSQPSKSPPQFPQSNYLIYEHLNLFTSKLSSTNNDRQKNYNNSAKLNNTIKQLKQQDRQASLVRYSKNNTYIQSAYCTVKGQIPLDPQILNDMLIYI